MGIRVLPPVVGMKRKSEAEAKNGSTHAEPAVFCGFVPLGAPNSEPHRTYDLCPKAEVWTEVCWTEDAGAIRVQ